jgi:hypothetical protein
MVGINAIFGTAKLVLFFEIHKVYVKKNGIWLKWLQKQSL